MWLKHDEKIQRCKDVKPTSNKKLMIRLQDNEMKRSQGDERMMTRWKNVENNDRCQGNDSMQSWEDRKCWQDRIQKKKKMEHPSRPVESTTGPCPTNSERCRTPHTKSFPAPSLHHTTHYIMRYLDKSKIKRRKICRGKPILAQVSFPAWSCGRLVVVHPRMVVSLYNLISSIMEDHNNITIKNMSVTSTSFLWYASRRKCVTFWFQ